MLRERHRWARRCRPGQPPWPEATAVGVVAGAVGLAASEAVARARQRPGEIPALWSRIAVSAALAAPLGWAAGRLTGAGPVAVGAVDRRGRRGARAAPAEGGARAGGRRRGRRGLAARRRGAPAAVVASATVLAYRVLSAAAVPRRAGEPAGRAGARPRSCRSSFRWRRGRATSAPAMCGSWPRCSAARTSPTPPTSASSPRSTSWPGRSSTRPGRPAGARVLRAHDPVPARHRARVAPVGAAGLPALPHARGPPAGPGQRADEPARGPARHPQPHRHDHAGGRRRRRRSRLDPVVRRQRRADLRRHLHDLPARRPRLRQRRVPAAAGAASRPRCCRGPGPAAGWC